MMWQPFVSPFFLEKRYFSCPNVYYTFFMHFSLRARGQVGNTRTNFNAVLIYLSRFFHIPAVFFLHQMNKHTNY